MVKKIMTAGYDLSSNTIGRVARHYLLSKFIPMGVYRGGAGIRCLFVLVISHYVGRPIFWFLTRYEPQVARLYNLIEKLK